MRPMTEAEITSSTRSCFDGPAGWDTHREGRLTVRYAMVRASVGYPGRRCPRSTLLIEDVATRNGYLHGTAQVNGAAAPRPAELTVELLDGSGGRLRMQHDAGSLTTRLRHPFDP